jgi:hypothetical protein
VLLLAGDAAEDPRNLAPRVAGIVLLHPLGAASALEALALDPAVESPDAPRALALSDRSHPITCGLEDLASPSGTPDAARPRVPDPWRALAWTGARAGEGAPWLAVREQDGRRLVFIAPGHDEQTLDPGLRTLLVRAAQWAALGRVDEGHATPNHLTRWERAVGWRPLFDGATLGGWRAAGGWSVERGELVLRPGSARANLLSDASFSDLELEFEFWLPNAAQGGVLYGAAGAPAAPLEYQILDDAVCQERLDPRTSGAALAGRCAPTGKAFAVPGRWHAGRILLAGNQVEHWLDGRRVVETSLADRLSVSAPIALEDGDTPMRFRSLYVRDLAHPPGTPVELFDGRSLSGWRALGDALFTVEDGAIVGRPGGGSQSFLVTEREFGDFVLELEVEAKAGNSGIQVHSHQDASGRVQGYQIEIDPSPRAWSGGLYDEGRAGWLVTLERNAQARAAFRPSDWNFFRIECAGPKLRAWVNRIPTVDYAHAADEGGFIGLQVHAGTDTRVRWRNLRLRELAAD